MERVRHIGNKAHGYTVEAFDPRVGFASCKVRRTDKGWAATFSGDPAKRNPWLPNARGGQSRSCMCPTVPVAGDFRTRREAGEAGIAAYVTEYEDRYPVTSS